MQRMLDEQEMKSLEEIDSALDSQPYSVDGVKEMLSYDEKGRIFQTIDNCMIAMKNDPVLSGAICHNDLTCKTDIIKNLGWGKPRQGGIRDVDINQIEWYLERTYGLRNYKAIGKAFNTVSVCSHGFSFNSRRETD